MMHDFSEALDLVQDKDFIRVVRGTGHSGVLVSSLAHTILPLNVIRLGAVHVSKTARTSDVVSVFQQVQEGFGVTQKDMFLATGIKHRTFHSWKRKAPASRPRLESVGRLWHLQDLLGELHDTLFVPVDHWLKANPKRLALFRAGDLETLLDLASGVDSAPSARNVITYSTGLGEDVDVPIVKSSTRNSAAVKFKATR